MAMQAAGVCSGKAFSSGAKSELNYAAEKSPGAAPTFKKDMSTSILSSLSWYH
jgi:hypothetical protein